MKSVAGGIRLELALYRELAAFSQFGSDLDASTQKTLARGRRLVELLKQGQYVPLEVGAQVVVLYAGTAGYLDKYPVEKIVAWENAFTKYLRAHHKDLLKKIQDRAKLKDVEVEIKAAIDDFDKGFVT